MDYDPKNDVLPLDPTPEQRREYADALDSKADTLDEMMGELNAIRYRPEALQRLARTAQSLRSDAARQRKFARRA